MEHTLYIRGGALVALALCGLRWPELALTIVLADIGLICILFALADLFVASAIRPVSIRSARKIAVLGFMGLGFGSVTLAIPILSLAHMMTAIMAWLVVSGSAVMLWGASLPRRERAGSIIAEWGAVQLLLAFLLPLLNPTSATAVLHLGAAYAAALGGAQLALGLLLRRAAERPNQVDCSLDRGALSSPRIST